MDCSVPDSQEEIIPTNVFDQKLKIALCKAMKSNSGEPENAEKLQNYKGLSEIPNQIIINLIKWSAKTSQDIAENSVTDEICQKLISLSYLADTICPEKQNHELAQATKLLAESKMPLSYDCDGVNFSDLYKFLYSSMSGFPDTTDLDEKSKGILTEAYKELMQKVEQDATPENLEELKSLLFQGKVTPVSTFSSLAQIFDDPSVNLFDLPFDKLMQIVEPDDADVNEEENPI